MEDSAAQDKQQQSMRIWKRTYINLQKVVTYTDETLVRALDRLVTQELRRLEKKKAKEEK